MKRPKTPELPLLTALSALLHFWHLFTPNAVVFDEMHYKHFAGHYLDGTHYFDVHPPFVKLLYAAVAWLAGVPANTMLGPAPVTILRVIPAFCGTLFVPLAYIILRQLGASRRVATLAGVAVLCENALLVDTRFALIEPIMICAALGAMSLYLAARRRNGLQRWALLAASTLLAGLAMTSKWTGASGLAVVLAAWAYDMWRESRRVPRIVGEGALLVAIPVAVYVATFAIHFALLRRTGVDQSFMSIAFRRTLIGGPQYDSTARMSLWAKLRDVHRAIRIGNRQLEYVTHPASSPWYTWPIMKHPIGMWENDAVASGRKQMIILLGNPVVWWGALLGTLAALAALARMARRKLTTPEQRYGLGFLAGAFAINYVPFMFIWRLMYLYHYLFALLVLVLLAAFAVGTVAGWNEGGDDMLLRFSSRRSRRAYLAIVALIVIGFLYFLPFTYGWPLSQRAYDQRFWVLHPL